MKKHTATLVMLLLVFGLGGCPLATITDDLEYDVLHYQNADQPFDLTGLGAWEDTIDLRKDDTFNDNKDKIENVDRVAFRGFMHTLNDADAIVDIFFREPVEPGETPNSWLVILENLAVPGASDADSPLKITYIDSEPKIQNFTQFQKLATKGIMELQLATRTGNDEVLVTKLIVYVALSGG